MGKRVAVLAVALLAACTATQPPLSTEGISAVVGSPERTAADRTNDIRRKPAEMLKFIGVRQGMGWNEMPNPRAKSF